MTEAEPARLTAADTDAHRTSRRVSLWLLLAIFLFGLAEIAVLPPWEGFDEIAHWSSIQQLADTGRTPRPGEGLSADRLSYAGPEPVGIDRRGRSYRALHDHPVAITQGPGRFSTDTAQANWEAQHPPLYYALMVPAYRLAHGLRWPDHLFVLRTLSWLMATAGLAMGALGIRAAAARAGSGVGPWAPAMALIWPLAFAGYVADLARIGNDSLCLLIFGAVWWLLLPLLARDTAEDRPATLRAILIGLLLGAGLWTKAFFGPISLGVAVLLLARAWRRRDERRRVDPRLALDAAFALGVAGLIGAGWYLGQLQSTGDISGSSEAVQLARGGGLMTGLARHASGFALVRGLAVMVGTIGWFGTWSLVRLNEIAMLVGGLLLGALTLQYLAALRARATLVAVAPLAVIAPLAAGLIYHVLIRMALDDSGTGTAGWYLHVLTPALGLMLALGWGHPRLYALGALWSVGYTALSWWAELRFFSGCVGGDGTKHYDFGHAVCGIDVGALSRFAHPGLALVAAGGGVIALAAAGWTSRRAWRAALVEAKPPEAQLQPL